MQRRENGRERADRIVGDMRIGDMALPPVQSASRPVSDPRRPFLIVSPSKATLVGSPTMQWSKRSPLASAQSSSFDRAVDRGAFLVAGDEEADRARECGPCRQIAAPPRPPPRARPSCRRRRGPRESRRRPRPENGSNRQRVTSPGGTTSVCPAKARFGARRPVAGVEIEHVGRSRRRECHELGREPVRSEQIAQIGQRAAVGGVTEGKAISARAMSSAAGRLAHARASH